MRNISLLSIAVMLLSCSGGADNNTVEENDSSSTEVITELEDTLATGWGEEPDTNGVEVFLEELPNKWILLSDEDGDGKDLVINEWCEAETQHFSFEPGKGEAWQIYLGYGQDGEICDVTFFEAYQNEETDIVSGTFRFKAAYDQSVRFVDFWWNESDFIGNFDGLGMASVWFVPEKSKDKYPTIKEDCEGLWE